MMVKKLLCLLTIVCLGAGASYASDEAEPAKADGPVVAEKAADDKAAADDATDEGEWKDYKVKAYSLSFYGGQFSGATYLDLPPLGPRTILTTGAGDVMAYDGSVLVLNPLYEYTAARKEIKAGTAYGGRVGIYVADAFHLDLVGNYMSGNAVTSMLSRKRSAGPNAEWAREDLEDDPGFRVYKGGFSLMYDARTAKFLGVTPLLGFGLGGVINRYSQGVDKTALYLEGNFGLSVEPVKDLRVIGRADVSTFAFAVDELGYSNMVNYKTYTIGMAWFIDTVPPAVRAAHEATPKRRR